MYTDFLESKIFSANRKTEISYLLALIFEQEVSPQNNFWGIVCFRKKKFFCLEDLVGFGSIRDHPTQLDICLVLFMYYF